MHVHEWFFALISRKRTLIFHSNDLKASLKSRFWSFSSNIRPFSNGNIKVLWLWMNLNDVLRLSTLIFMFMTMKIPVRGPRSVGPGPDPCDIYGFHWYFIYFSAFQHRHHNSVIILAHVFSAQRGSEIFLSLLERAFPTGIWSSLDTPPPCGTLTLQNF